MKKVTTSIKELQNENILSEKGPFTHRDILLAAATYAMIHAEHNNIHSSNELYETLVECTELAFALNEIDIDTLYDEAEALASTFPKQIQGKKQGGVA